MLSLTRMLTGDVYYGDDLRYRDGAAKQKNGVSEGRGPVVAWNYTRTCNLKCMHCYSSSENRRYEQELTTEEAKNVIDDLAEMHVPTILFSGGEPLMRPDFFILANYAKEKGIRPTLSTNGTLITPELAEKIKETGIGYVGISLDGVETTNDRFRGVQGAYQRALQGVRNCRAVGQRVGFRFTINRNNYQEIPLILDLMEQEDVDRICFYHLVYTGRGEEIMADDLTHEETRQVLDLIIDRTLDFHRRGLKKEVLMVDNHADGPYLCLKYRETEPERAAYIYQLLSRNGGNRSGIAFANIDNLGNVHPDQFTRQHTLGNVKERKFSEIWKDTSNPIMAGLKDRHALLDERCRNCNWLSICNGNFRARGEAVTGDFWGFDPACYLTEAERKLPVPGSTQCTTLFPSDYKIDAVDRKILMQLQKGIPFHSRPYQIMAEEIGITEQEVLERIAVLKEQHIIRRMSGFFNSRKLGYTSVLCAIAVDPAHIEEVAAYLNDFPGITHNYLRQNHYNMWFTLISSCEEELETILNLIEQQPHVEQVLRFYSEKRFKIDVTFDLQKGGVSGE